MAQDVGVYQDTVPIDGEVTIWSNIHVTIYGVYTILAGGVLVLQPAALLVVIP